MNQLEMQAPSAMEPEAHMEESYALLRESLQEFLENEDLQLYGQTTDYLEGVLEKINMSIMISGDDEHRSALEALKRTAWRMVTEQFVKDYDGLVDPESIDPDNLSEARFIYHFFYYDRRKNILEMTTSSTVQERKALAQRYKKETKRDFMLNRLKIEVPEVPQVYLPVIAFYGEIAAEYLSTDRDLLKEATSLQLSYDQFDFVSRVFANGDSEAAFRRYAGALLDHDDYQHFLVDFRDMLIEKTKGIN